MSGSTRLAMDIYKPATAGGAKLPALVFFNRATGADGSGRFYSGWARAAASNGVIGIFSDLRDGSERPTSASSCRFSTVTRRSRGSTASQSTPAPATSTPRSRLWKIRR